MFIREEGAVVNCEIQKVVTRSPVMPRTTLRREERRV
jgi:hypothetical protein